jgi:hypothetical protein
MRFPSYLESRLLASNHRRRQIHSLATLSSLLLAFLMLGCAEHQQVSNEATLDAAPAYGVGGTMRTIDGVNIWLDGGTPACLFRVLRTTTTNYWTGAVGDRGQREAALRGLAADAAKDKADGVIVYRESKEITGFVALLSLRAMKDTQPGLSGSNITYSISSAQVKCLQPIPDGLVPNMEKKGPAPVPFPVRP